MTRFNKKTTFITSCIVSFLISLAYASSVFAYSLGIYTGTDDGFTFNGLKFKNPYFNKIEMRLLSVDSKWLSSKQTTFHPYSRGFSLEAIQKFRHEKFLYFGYGTRFILVTYKDKYGLFESISNFFGILNYMSLSGVIGMDYTYNDKIELFIDSVMLFDFYSTQDFKINIVAGMRYILP